MPLFAWKLGCRENKSPMTAVKLRRCRPASVGSARPPVNHPLVARAPDQPGDGTVDTAGRDIELLRQAAATIKISRIDPRCRRQRGFLLVLRFDGLAVV